MFLLLLLCSWNLFKLEKHTILFYFLNLPLICLYLIISFIILLLFYLFILFAFINLMQCCLCFFSVSIDLQKDSYLHIFQEFTTQKHLVQHSQLHLYTHQYQHFSFHPPIKIWLRFENLMIICQLTLTIFYICYTVCL